VWKLVIELQESLYFLRKTTDCKHLRVVGGQDTCCEVAEARYKERLNPIWSSFIFLEALLLRALRESNGGVGHHGR